MEKNGIHYPLPIFLNVDGRHCVVIGGGAVALRKINDLLEAGASVTVIAEEPCADIVRLKEKGNIDLLSRRYTEGDTDGAFLVFAATDDSDVNRQVFEEADGRSILVNVVDKPGLCNFFSGAVVKRGPLRIAVSTSGCCPALAKELRRELETVYPDSWTAYTEAAGEWRQKILALDGIDEAARKTALGRLGGKDLYTLFRDYGKDRVWDELQRIIFTS